MINSMLAHYDQSVEHLLPVWSLQGNETWCMIGYHAVAVIADAYFKGVRGFDAKRAYQAMKTTAMNPHYDNVAAYAKLGWVPFDKENESVSKTLEYAYDDYCIARMAKALGKKDDYKYFMKRAGSYRNVFDPSIGLMRGKDSHGHWRTPFDPHLYFEGCDFTEGTAWQYSWYVPQDVPGLIALMGGREKFTAKLDQLFTFPPNTSKGVEDIQGRIGEYWHGNEPSHHIIYLYCYAGQPWKAQARLHEVLRTQYGNQPDSLSRQRRLRPDVGLVHLHRAGVLSGLPGERLLRDRQPGRAEGRRTPLERQDTFDRRPEPFGQEHLRPIAGSQRQALDLALPAPPRNQGRRPPHLHDGPPAEQAVGRGGQSAGVRGGERGSGRIRCKATEEKLRCPQSTAIFRIERPILTALRSRRLTR